jgi:hypothetical protein
MASLKSNISPSEVLAKAVLRTAVALKIDEKHLAKILSLDKAFLTVAIEPVNCPGLRAQQLIRIYQRLSAITGNDDAAISHWMTTSNRRFDCSPRNRMQTGEGLDDVTYYLESIL